MLSGFDSKEIVLDVVAGVDDNSPNPAFVDGGNAGFTLGLPKLNVGTAGAV